MSVDLEDRPPGNAYDGGEPSWRTNLQGVYDGLEDSFNGPDAKYPKGHPSAPKDGGDIAGREGAVGSGVPGAGAQLPNEDSLGAASKPGVAGAGGDAGPVDGAVGGATSRIKNLGKLAGSNRGRNGIVGGIIGLVIAVFGVTSLSSLNMQHYQNGIIKGITKVAMRKIRQRRTKNIVNGLKKLDDKLNDKARSALAEDGLKLNFASGESSGPPTSIEFTDASGKTGVLDMTASDLDAEMARFFDEGGLNFADEFLSKVAPENQTLSELTRGPVTENWRTRLGISENPASYEKPPAEGATPEETLKDDVAHSSDELTGEKPILTEAGAVTDPGGATDANGKPIPSDASSVDAAKADLASQTNDLVNPATDRLPTGSTAAEGVTDSVDNALVDGTAASLGKIAAEVGPTVATDAAEVTAEASVNPLILGQQACKVKGSILNINNLRRSVYALELIRFGYKWASVASKQKEGGVGSSFAVASMEFWMSSKNSKTGKSFGGGGAFLNATGNKSVHASKSDLSRFSVGFASAGILATIEKVISPFTGACKIAGNTFLNLGAAVIGIGAAIFTGGASALATAAAEAAPILAIVISQEIVTQIATPMLIRTGAHLVLSSVSPGDVLEAAVVSGFAGGLMGTMGTHAMGPATKAQHSMLLIDAQLAEARDTKRMSFKDRYLSLNGETSLVSKIRLSFAHGTQTIAQGGVTDLVASLASTTKNKINSVVSPAAYAQTQVDSYCNDPQILSYGIAADDFCNTFNERTPVNLNLKDTRQKLIDHGDIDLLTGQPTSADFKAYIKQCASGAPSILYRNDVKTDGGDDGKTDLCVTPGVALKGETKTVAEAYGYKDLQTRNIAWWQKLIGSSAFAAPTDPSASQLVGIHDHYLNWLGYLDDMTDVNQTFTNNFDNNVSTVTGGNTTAPSSTVINVIIGKDTSSIPCASGEVGTAADGYLNGVLNKIRICNVNGMNVNSQVSKNVADLLAAAKSQGVALSSGSFRTMQAQIDVYNRWCAADGITPTPPPYPKLKFSDYTLCAGGAPPGYSNHQMGFAIDFNCDGVLISRTYANASTNHCFQWLVANAGTYGFYEFGKGKPSSRSGDAYEGWHWSIDGN